MARNGNNWSVFGLAGDPVPGDPLSIQNVGHMLTARETAAYEVSVGVNGLATDPEVNAWLGTSGDAFRKTLEPVPGLLRQMVDAYNEAAAAVFKYAGDLATAQRFADSAYQRRTQTIADWKTKNPGKALPADGMLPDGVMPGVWGAEMSSITEGAIPSRDQAAGTCAKALQDAEDRLRRVQSALGDPKFADFNATYVKNGGDLSEFTRAYAPVDVFGDVLEKAEVTDLNNILNGGKTDASPDVVRAELDELTSEYQNDGDFWHQFAPSLGKVVDWVHSNQGPGSTPTTDQALVDTLGHRMATAASNGSLSSLDVTGLGTASMIGLAKLIGTTKGSDYQNQSGSDFLAFTTQAYIDGEGGVDAWDKQSYDGAMNTVLGVTGQNDAAARTLFSGTDGQHLVTELLTGEAQVTRDQYAGRAGSREVTGTGYDGVDPKNIAALLDAARQPVDASGVRGDTPADMERINAANNIVVATAAFDHWTPPGQSESWKLPPEVTNSLEGYAKAYSYDLGVSTTDDNNGAGITSIDGKASGPPMFVVTSQQVHDFLNLSLKDPHAAGDYLGFAKGQYQDSMKLAMQGGGNHTEGYANLVGAAQQNIDEQNLQGAQVEDAAAAQRAALVNALLGGAGNAPGPSAGPLAGPVGIAQTLDGLVTPYVDQLPGLQTDHAAEMQIANHQADQLISGKVDLSVAQAAYDSGVLKVGSGADDIPAGIVDANGHVQDNAQFRAWFSENNDLKVPPSGDPNRASMTLGGYVQQTTNAMNRHS